MPDVDKHEQTLEKMRSLPPLRNINAIRAWMEVHLGAEMVGIFDMFARDAAKGAREPKIIVLIAMAAFAAGRTYQEANPDAPKDPDGYGG